SKRAFFTAMEITAKNDQMALISASALGANMAAIMTIDGAIPYSAAGYERVMTHHYQAPNFLAAHSLEGASVEIRRACAEQNAALKRFENEVEKARKDGESKGVRYGESQIPREYAQLNEIAGRVKNSFQNAYTFYLSGIVYEALDMDNDAYIDYKKALEIFPDNKYLQEDVLRLASSLRMDEDTNELTRRFKKKPRPLLQQDEGEMILLLESGFIPHKQELHLTVSAGNKVVAISIPVYTAKKIAPPQYTIKANGKSLGSPEMICDFYALAAKDLREQAPIIMTRQILRAITKVAMQNEAQKRLGQAGALAAAIYSIATEQADLRSWLTLPSVAQVMRVPMKMGKHKITLSDPTGVVTELEVEIAAGRRTIIHAVETNKRHIYPTVITAI
ncbi:MAG: hypothetical protein K9K75_05425, partial [Deltaproteobacteria bacterium]|nr:hypothetical protein [Deltaproteobacteria bacterium]